MLFCVCMCAMYCVDSMLRCVVMGGCVFLPVGGSRGRWKHFLWSYIVLCFVLSVNVVCLCVKRYLTRPVRRSSTPIW